MGLSAITTMQHELTKIQQAQSECVNAYGVIRNGYKYKYQILVQQASEFRSGIRWMESQTGIGAETGNPRKGINDKLYSKK